MTLSDRKPMALSRLIAFILLSLLSLQPAAAATALVLNIEGGIGPAVTEYVRRGLEDARERKASIVILRLNTPGGLDSSTRDIVQAILASPVPVAAFVAPSGARAASAGAYILYASHVAAMAPGTNVGAATPVRMGAAPTTPTTPGKESEQKQPVGPDAMERKIVNDSVAWIRGLADLHGRNADWAEKAVREGASVPAREALERKVIEIVAGDVQALLTQLDGRTAQVLGQPVTLATAGLAVETLEPDWRLRLLAAITNPNIAYVLLLAGVYGLIFEILAPGSMIPGSLGAVSLLVGLYALNMLDVNIAGALLIVLGFGFLVAEALTPTFGILGVAGAIAFLAGSLLLFRGQPPEFTLSPWVIGAATLSTLGIFAWAAAAGLSAWRRPVNTGDAEFRGATGRVLDWRDNEGHVRLHGEIWRAVGPPGLVPGAHVRVAARDGLTLRVAPAAPPKGERHAL